MTFQKIKKLLEYSLVFQSLLIFLCFIAVAFLGMILNPLSFQKFFYVATQSSIQNDSLSYYWDVSAYAELVLNLQCSAFYPLWPSLVRYFYHPNNLHEAAYILSWISRGFFAISLPFLIVVFRKAIQSKILVFSLAFLYSISPFSIFRVIGYTESIFSFFSLILIFCLLQSSEQDKNLLFRIINILAIGIIGGLISLTRPTLLQIIGSCLATLLTLWFVSFFRNQSSYDHSLAIRIKNTSFDFVKNQPLAIPVSLSLIIGAGVGYSIYGYFCWKTTGNFWEAFAQQELWNKSLGFRPWLLLTSRSPLQDLWGLYFPLLLWSLSLGNLLELFRAFKMPRLNWNKINLLLMIYPPVWIVSQGLNDYFTRKEKVNNNLLSLDIQETFLPLWTESYTFWFSLYFACSHSAIVFLTQDRLVSLGRYIFGQPFIFLVLGYLLLDFKYAIKFKEKYFYFYGFASISLMLFLEQWVRYGHNQWLG